MLPELLRAGASLGTVQWRGRRILGCGQVLLLKSLADNLSVSHPHTHNMQMSEFESKGRNHARLGILAQFSYWDHQGEQQGNLTKEGAWAKLNCCRWASSERTAVIVQENEFNKGKPPSALWGNGGGEVPCEQDPAYQSLQLKKKLWRWLKRRGPEWRLLLRSPLLGNHHLERWFPHCQPQRHKGAFSCGRRKSDYAILLSMQNRRVTSLGISTKVLMLDSLRLDEIPCKGAMSKCKSES